MQTKLHWIDIPEPGKLAVSARPRGGDWLEDECRGWVEEGVNVVVSMLTPEETVELGLEEEQRLCRRAGLEFTNFPIQDRMVPDSDSAAARLILTAQGIPLATALDLIGRARGVPVPETPQQLEWLQKNHRSVHLAA